MLRVIALPRAQNIQIILSILIYALLAFWRLGTVFLSDGVVAYEDWAPLSTWGDLFRPYVIPWDYLHNLGSPVPLTTLGNIIYNLPLLALTRILGSAVMAVKVQLLLMLWLSGTSWLLYYRRLTHSHLGAFLGGLWMMINPFINTRFELAHGTMILAYVLSPLLLLCFHDLLFQGDIKRGVGILPLSIVIGLLSPAMIFMNLLFILSLSFSISKLSSISTTSKMIRLSYFLLLISFSLLALTSLLLVTGAGAPSINVIRAEEAGIPWDPMSALSRYPSIIAVALFSLPLGLYAYRSRRQSASEVTRIYLTAIAISSGLSATLIFLALQPRGLIFKIIFYQIPGLQLFREVGKLLFLPVIGAGLIFAKVGQHSRGELRGLKLPALGVASIILLLSSILPSSPVKLIDLPQGYQELRLFLGAQREDFRVAYLPPASWATRFSWADHYFLDPAVVFMPKPTVYMVSEQEQSPGSSFTRWIYSSFYQGRTSRLGSLMGLLGVKYIILRTDADTPKTHDGLRWMGAGETLELLPHQRDIKVISRFGSYMVYGTANYHPTLYSADHIIATVGDRNILHTILEMGLPVWNKAIIPLETDQYKNELLERRTTIAIQGGNPTPLLAALEGLRIRAWEGLEFSSNPSDAWYNGGAAWWHEGGGSTQPLMGSP